MREILLTRKKKNNNQNLKRNMWVMNHKYLLMIIVPKMASSTHRNEMLVN